jgi:hypothetical protein
VGPANGILYRHRLTTYTFGGAGKARAVDHDMVSRIKLIGLPKMAGWGVLDTCWRGLMKFQRSL